MVTIASEYFGVGAGRNVAIAGTRNPGVVLDVSSANGIDQGNTATLTFTLNGATFGAAVSGGNLKIQRYVQVKNNPGGGTATYTGDSTFNNNATVRLTAGGGAGESSVSFLVTAGSMELVGREHPGMNLGGAAFPADRAAYMAADLTADSGSQTDEVDFITFSLPNLQVTGATLGEGMTAQTGVFVTASIVQGTTTGDSFPKVIRGTGTMPANSVNPVADGMVLATAPVISVTLSGGTDAEVALAARTQLMTGGGAVPVRLAADGDPVQALLVSNLGIAFTAGPDQLVNNADAFDGTALDSSLGGNVDVSVSGRFQEGDKMYMMSAGGDPQALTIAADTAVGTVPLARPTSMQLLYVPGGTANLTPRIFRAAAALDFTDGNNKSGPVLGANDDAEISYAGISAGAYAYGVAAASDDSTASFVRLGCVGVTPPATACTVFADCEDEAGTEYFGELAPIPNNATAIYSSQAIHEGLEGMGWASGWGNCYFLSNGGLEGQHMMRTSGDSRFINNSVVVGASGEGQVGILKSTGLSIVPTAPTRPGATTVTLAITGGTAYVLPATGRIWGPIDVIQSIAAQIAAGQVGAPPRLNAPPSSPSGGFVGQHHGGQHAFLEPDGETVTATATVTSPPGGYVPLESGDVRYSDGAVWRTSTGSYLTTVATTTPFMLSGW